MFSWDVRYTGLHYTEVLPDILLNAGAFAKDSQHPFEGSKLNAADITLGFYGVIFAYDGW